MKIGYARVSTQDQSLALQLDALRQAGCRQIYEEIVSGARVERPVLQAMLTHLREGDVMMIWKLDRLGRSLRHLIDVVTTLAQRGIGFKSLQENLDTTTSRLLVGGAAPEIRVDGRWRCDSCTSTTSSRRAFGPPSR